MHIPMRSREGRPEKFYPVVIQYGGGRLFRYLPPEQTRTQLSVVGLFSEFGAKVQIETACASYERGERLPARRLA